MNEYLQQLFEKYRSKGAILDTNLLLVYLIGRYRVRLVGEFKRTQKYSQIDFTIIRKTVRYFVRVVVTPHILAEVSNFSRQVQEQHQSGCARELARIVDEAKEEFVPATEICAVPDFASVGITDAGIEKSAAGRYLVVTDDFSLSNRLQRNAVDAVNFYHLRFPVLFR